VSVALIPTVVGGASAAVSSASALTNLLAGFSPSISGFDVITQLAKDIGTFEFSYIGEERIEAGAELTDHYSESNRFMQDHSAIKPRIVIMRGFVAENTFNKTSLLPVITAAVNALAPVTPYLGNYSRGSAALMTNAISQTDQIINQLAQVQAVTQGAAKLLGLLPSVSKVMQAFITLDNLRIGGATFAAVTPWGTFGDNAPNDRLGPVMIENLIGVGPEDTRGWADFIVRLKEIRVAPSLNQFALDNARAPGSSTNFNDGTVSANTAGDS
jgi:hypothetical protein